MPAGLRVFDILLDGRTSVVTESWHVRRQQLAALLQPPGSSRVLRLSDAGDLDQATLRPAWQRRSRIVRALGHG